MTQQFLSTVGVPGQQIEAVGPEGPVRMVLGAVTPPVVDPAAFRARNIVDTNVDNLEAFDLATTYDGVPNDTGDVVLLVAQTTLSENGPYVVGTNSAGIAPLTRPTWWSTGTTFFSGVEVVLTGEGIAYKNTEWAAMTSATTFVVDTDDPSLYPRVLTGQCVLGSVAEHPGIFEISAPILSSKVGLSFMRVVQNVPNFLDTVIYAATDENSSSVVPGPIGTGKVTVFALDSSGNVATTDDSTINYTIVNQA